MITLTRYKSFKLNIIINKTIINNLNYKKIVKRIYNKFIEWTFSVIGVLIQVPLVIAEVTMKVIVKIEQAIIFVVDEVFDATTRIIKGLIERLSVKD